MSTLLGIRLPAAELSVLAAAARLEPQGQRIVLGTVDQDHDARPARPSSERSSPSTTGRSGCGLARQPDEGNLDRGHPVLFVLAAPPDVFHVAPGRPAFRTLPTVAGTIRVRRVVGRSRSARRNAGDPPDVVLRL